MDWYDFYSIARYGNMVWKGYYSDSEVIHNANIYYQDFVYSKGNATVSFVMQNLITLLLDDCDGRVEQKSTSRWLYDILKELGLADMDFHDYDETEEGERIIKFLEEYNVNEEF